VIGGREQINRSRPVTSGLTSCWRPTRMRRSSAAFPPSARSWLARWWSVPLSPGVSAPLALLDRPHDLQPRQTQAPYR